jgi:GDPmannose 4,6-dehydratase
MSSLTPATCALPRLTLLIGDSTKARTQLGWSPSVTFEELVHLMVESDLKALGIEQDHFGKNEDTATLRRDVLRMMS